MLLWLRKFLFYVLLIAYFIITPYLILYGLGYVFNPSERELFKSGLVSIVSEPKGASLYIEGRKFSHRTPTVMRGLLPGTYQVRVSQKGFESWNKEVQIFPERATRLDPVILIPQKPEFESLTPGPYRNIFPRVSDFKIFAIAGDQFSDIAKIDLLFKKESSLNKENKNSSVEILDWKIKKESGVLLLTVKNQGKLGYFLYDLDREKIIKDLSNVLPEKTEDVQWESKNPESIYFLKDKRLSGFDFEKDASFSILSADVLGFGINHSKLYILKTNFSLWQTNLRGENLTEISEKEGVAPQIFAGLSSRFFKVEVIKREFFQKELILFTGDRGALISNWPPYRLADQGVLGFRHTTSGDNEKILYWTASEIAMFDFSFNADEEENLPPRLMLYRSGTQIHQAFWAYENSHVVFQDKNEVFLLEAGDQAPYLVRSFQPVAPQTDIVYNERQHAIYYLDLETKKVMKRKISE